MIRHYLALSNQVFKNNDHSLVPIRDEDKYPIMKWRNDQLYHLRQNKPLTSEDQDKYFQEVVPKLFEQPQPNQLLFSYLHRGKCIGYGGLVHINWIDSHAEISFVMDTDLENKSFKSHWLIFLNLVEQVAFSELILHKIYIYSFELRPRLYELLRHTNFQIEGRLKDHYLYDGQYVDALYHSLINGKDQLQFRKVEKDDEKVLFDWVNEETVRNNSINSDHIDWETHREWFRKVLSSDEHIITIFFKGSCKIGQVRLDKNDDSWVVDFSVDRRFRRRGYGTKMLKIITNEFRSKKLVAHVKISNLASQRVFERMGFKLKETKKGNVAQKIFMLE